MCGGERLFIFRHIVAKEVHCMWESGRGGVEGGERGCISPSVSVFHTGFWLERERFMLVVVVCVHVGWVWGHFLHEI